MAKLCLKDVARYTEEKSNEDLIGDPDMQQYVDEMQTVGQSIIKNLPDEELAVVVSFMQAMFSYQLMNSNPMLGMIFISNTKETGIAMAKSLMFAIGVMLSEDWR